MDTDVSTYPPQDAVELYPPGPQVAVWLLCETCGKQYQEVLSAGPGTSIPVGRCEACILRRHEARDECPQLMYARGEAGSYITTLCSKAFRHQGRCEPRP